MTSLRRNIMTFREGELLDESSQEMIHSMNIVRTAYNSIMRNDLTYISMPITSGERFYNVLEKYGVFDAKDLPDGALYEEIILPNIQEYTEFAKKIQEKNPDKIVIAPSVFEAKKQRWSQKQYMYLWYWVVQDKISKGILADKFSNGGSEEAVCMNEVKYQMFNTGETMPSGLPHYMPTITLTDGSGIGFTQHKLISPKIYSKEGKELPITFNANYVREGKDMKIFDREEKELSIEDNATIITNSIQNLRERGFKTKRLETCLLNLAGIAKSMHSYTNYFHQRGLESQKIHRGYIYNELKKVIPNTQIDYNFLL